MTPFERLVSMMIKPLFLLSFWLFIALSFFYFDRPIAYFFHGLHLGRVHDFFVGVTRIGGGYPYLVLLPLLALFFRFVQHQKARERSTWFLWLCVVIPSVVCIVLKMVLGRARPELLFDQHIYGFYGFSTHANYWSFPSGHSSTMMGFIIGMCILFPRYVYLFVLLCFSVLFSRLILTEHYLADVLSASYLAIVEIGLFVWWLRLKKLLIYAA